ncbi:MAG: hypothetical protein Q9215_003334 [Flavoplaca cf. flavocitrina]
MVSRKDGAPTKPLAVAGRCKPMKVEKSKKVRVHKVKQGTPPKLSASQKRKLNLLSVQYNQMRPKDTSVRRQRALQMQRYLDSRRPREVMSTKFKATSQTSKASLSQSSRSHNDDHGERNFSTGTGRSEPTISPETEQSHLNEFDILIDVTGYAQDPDLQLDLTEDNPTPVSSFFAFKLDADQFLDPNSGPQLPESEGDIEWPADSLPFYEPQLPELEGGLDWPMDSLPFSERGNEQDTSQEIGLNVAVASVPVLVDTHLTEYSDTREPLPHESQDQVSYYEGLPGSTLCDHTVRLSGHSAYSSLSALVDRLSKCSLGEKDFIKDSLRRFSVSTVSSESSSIVYKALTQLVANSDNYVSFKPARSQDGRSALLPGDFISSDVNTFWSHIACRTSKTSDCNSMLFCESCCRAQIGHDIKEIWSIPYAVIRVKKCLVLQEKRNLDTRIWYDQGNPWWVDRFGNTSLHIAAAIGATCEELQDIMRKGEDKSIHITNTASQTFMHSLNPQLMSSGDLLSLTDYLRERDFKFDHRDVRGHTFIDLLESRGVDIAKCWPTSIVCSLRKELAKVVPPWSETWSYSGSTRLCARFKVPEHVLSRFKHFTDHHGQNYLHAAVGNTKFPSDISEQTFAGSRLSLVRDLLSVGVELDHHSNCGETPLMTHIQTVPEQDDIILELLHSGADVNARNEKGETALHISVRLGDIVVTKALLAQRATVNVHVRNWDGKGVLAVAAKAAHSAEVDVGLYAKITTCMALAIDSGAIMAPTLFDEWDLREPAREILRKDGFLVAPKEDEHRYEKGRFPSVFGFPK